MVRLSLIIGVAGLTFGLECYALAAAAALTGPTSAWWLALVIPVAIAVGVVVGSAMARDLGP